jgi:hypothetical protein
VARIDDAVAAALNSLPLKPADNAKREDKKAYSEKLSAAVAVTFGQELRLRGMAEARPASPGELDSSGAERRMAGGIGAKKVDVTWATEESGLLFAISIKSISFRDTRTKNYQKNLTNRRGDMLIEAVTLHRRFPYSVLTGMFFFDYGAAEDGTANRRSTFENAHTRFKLFTGRNDPAGRDEQYERFYILLLRATDIGSTLRAYAVGDPLTEVPLADVFDDLVRLVAERNPDFYEYNDGRLMRANG